MLGLTAGPALVAIAGARRTASAYPRFLRSVDASTVAVTSSGDFDPKAQATIAGLPNVTKSRTSVAFNLAVLDGGKPRLTTQDFEVAGTFDGRFFEQDRFIATHGRRPDPGRVDEVAVNEVAAKRLDFRVGQPLDLGAYSSEQQTAPDFFTDPPVPVMRVRATVVGIGLFPDEVLQDDGDRSERMLVTPAFSRAARPYATFAIQGLVLAHGDRDLGAVKQRIDQLAPPGTIEYRVTSVDAFHAQHAVRPLAIALGVFGVIVGIAGLVLTAQALTRVLRAEVDEQRVLRVLGASTSTVARGALIVPVVAIVAGALLAGALAIVASPSMPIGAVRRVDPARGLDVDRAVIGLGVAIIVVVLAAYIALLAYRSSARRLARARVPARRAPKVVTAASGAGLNAPAVVGLRFALNGPDETSPASTRSVMVGAVIAIASLVAAVTFGVSLNALVHEPRLYGWSGDAVITAAQGYGNIDLNGAHAILDRDANVERWSGAQFGFATLDEREVPVLGMAPGSAVIPPLVKGRPPSDVREIVLGAATASELHKSVGDTVVIAGEHPEPLSVVGIATFPTIGKVHAAHTSLGVGAMIAPGLVPGVDRDVTDTKRPNLGPRAIFVRYRAGVDAAAELDHLRTTTRPLAGFAGLDVLPVQRPAEIVNSSEVGRAPILFAAGLVIGAMVSLGLALAGSVRHHRRDLTMLKTLGFTRHQLAATVAWHATTTTVIALLVGVPLGIVSGRVLWGLFARQLDVLVEPSVPVLALAVLAFFVLLAANISAAAPARAARRVNAASLLRSE